MNQTIVATPPRWEPISVSDMKLHLRIDSDDEDALLWSMIRAARENAEVRCVLALPQQGLELHLDEWPFVNQWPRRLGGFGGYGLSGAPILLRQPLISVDSIKYRLGVNGSELTVDPSAYKVTLDGVWPYQLWPTGLAPEDAITVSYTAGYASADDIPERLVRWIAGTVGRMYETRENQTFNGRLGLSPYQPLDDLISDLEGVLMA